jgi:hypothetical protein
MLMIILIQYANEYRKFVELQDYCLDSYFQTKVNSN